MKNNVISDISELQHEGNYPYLYQRNDSILDNFTDALMINHAVYDAPDTSVFDKAVMIYQAESEDAAPIDSLAAYINNRDGLTTGEYARYWHGYLLILKPVLCFTSYLILRTLNHYIQILLLVITSILLWKKLSWKCMIPYLASMFFLRIQVIYFSLQYSTMFYVTTLGVIILALFRKQICKSSNIQYFFFILGIVTNYFDYLTYPLISLGVCLVIVLMMSDYDQRGYKNIWRLISLSVIWTLGYAGMWIGKWILGSVITGNNLFSAAISSALIRSSADNGEGSDILRIAAVIKNIRTAFGYTPLLYIIGLITSISIGIWQWRKHLKAFLYYTICMVMIALMPIIWYLVLANHSYLHFTFTFRALAVTVCSLTAIAWKVDEEY